MIGVERISMTVCVNIKIYTKWRTLSSPQLHQVISSQEKGFCTQLLLNWVFLWARLLGQSLEMDLLCLEIFVWRAWDLMERAFWFTRAPKGFFPFTTFLIHYTEFHISGEMPEPFSALYSKENQISNLPRKKWSWLC